MNTISSFTKILFAIISAIAVFWISTPSISKVRVPSSNVHPVVWAETQNSGFIVGGTAGSKWLKPDAIAKRMSGKKIYKLYSDSGFMRSTKGSKPQNEDGRHFIVEFPHSVKEWEIAIAGDWNAMPRKPKASQIHSKAYRQAVLDVFRQKGLSKAPVNINQVVSVDLDGDSNNEILISAKSPGYDPNKYIKSQYSFVLLLIGNGSKAKSFILAGEFHTKNKSDDWPEYYGFSGVWDIDGDGVLEIGLGWYNRRADFAGIQLFDFRDKKPVLLYKDGIGH